MDSISMETASNYGIILSRTIGWVNIYFIILFENISVTQLTFISRIL